MDARLLSRWVGVLIGTAALLAPLNGFAARVTAALGYCTTGSCSRSIGMWMNNNMVGTATLEVPVTVTAHQNYSLSARMRGVGTNCKGVRVDGNNGDSVQSAGGTSTLTGWATYSLGTLNVIGGTSLLFRCSIAASPNISNKSAVEAFDWN